MRVPKDRAIGLKLDRHRVMWVGGDAAGPDDDNTCFIYDTRTRTFRETAPIPSVKKETRVAAAGVLSDGTVVFAGGGLADLATGQLTQGNRLSYLYHPRTDHWTRTGDLPEAQEWLFTPTTLLEDGRLLIAGGIGLAERAKGTGSLKAFVYDARQKTTVDVVNPETGRKTGKKAVVQGRWDYTRKTDGTVSKLHSGHIFGNAALLKDCRVLVGGGHATWDYPDTDASVLATHTDFFDPATGVWSKGAPFPRVAGEDDRIGNSNGGRTNGVGFAVMENGKVVIAGGYTAVDGEAYFDTVISRQSILVMSPAKKPLRSHYRLSPNRIPSGKGSGALLGDNGRGQVLTYAIAGNRAVIAGGQNNFAEDLYDSYVYDVRSCSLARGPDMVHGLTEWAADNPDEGYPADYQASKISTRAVSMNNSKLVFDHHLLVHGGGSDATDVDGLPNGYAEQVIAR
ncbi:MAG: hypothetical protein JWR85_2199 [Marmoricola sp.]|nr:hypothetical protein [Marmoricola sp.]